MKELFERVHEKLANGDHKGRIVIGIVGCPGSGKSTLAELLVNRLNADDLQNPIAQILPLDGFHLANDVLENLGLRELKGIPDTFDAEAYIQKLKEAKQDPPKILKAPRFDREIEASIEDGIYISPETKVIITEGNYLLLESEPWAQIADLLDDCWYLRADPQILTERLIERHMTGGRGRDQAIEKVQSTDLPNARLVEVTKVRAQMLVKPAEEPFEYVIQQKEPKR